MNNLGLRDQIAIVTGGGKGIGRQTAKTLGENGVSTVIADIDFQAAKEAEREIKATGAEAIAVKTDVCNLDSVRSMVQTTISTYNKVDILVNVVGGGKTANFLKITEEEWDRMFQLNIKSMFLCCREVIKFMIANKYGKIVNISSLAGRSASVLQGAHYTASKHAVIGLTRHLAREFGPYGINSNAVAPGVTKTERIMKTLTPEYETEMVEKIPLRRLSTPKDQANVILFAVSKLADYLNGAVLDVNGGYWLG